MSGSRSRQNRQKSGPSSPPSSGEAKGARPFIRKEKVPVAVNPKKTLQVKWQAEGPLKDSFVIAVIGGDQLIHQYTIHRPIGFTDLDDDDWVCSRTGDIQDLLSRQDDPGREARQKAVTGFLIEKVVGELQSEYPISIVDGVVMLDGHPRPEVLKPAHKAVKDKGMDHMNGAFPTYIGFLNRKIQAAETEFWLMINDPKWKEWADSQFSKSTYRTMGGPKADRPQFAAFGLKSKSKQEALDVISRRIWSAVNEGLETPVEKEDSGSKFLGTEVETPGRPIMDGQDEKKSEGLKFDPLTFEPKKERTPPSGSVPRERGIPHSASSTSSLGSGSTSSIPYKDIGVSSSSTKGS